MNAFRTTRWLVLASIALIAGCETTPSAPPPPPSSPTDLGVARLARFKTESEDWARRIKGDFPLGSTERRNAETKYIAARGAVDGWIAQYKLELARDREDPRTEAYLTAFTDATDKGQQYVDYVNELYVKGIISPEGVTLIGEVYKILKQVVSDIVTSLRENRVRRKKEIVEVLETLKWKPFPEL